MGPSMAENISLNHQEYFPVTTTGPVYLDNGSDGDVLQKLDVLKSFHVFVVQKKTAVDCFSSTITHEILDNRKNVILKATKQTASYFSRTSVLKISVKNLRNVKLFGIAIESTNNMQTEATINVYPNGRKRKIAHVEKYGGTYSPPSFEIFNIDAKTAFTIDLNGAKSINTTAMSEYDINTKKGVVGSIMMKSGLNFILSTDNSMQVIEKATLLAVILAMDILKTGTREKEAPSNQYLFH